MCLGYNGGILTLGGIDNTYSNGPIQYTPIIRESYYVVNMLDLLVDNTSIGIPSVNYNQTIVDSGTTLLVFPTSVYNSLVKYFLGSVCPSLPDYLKPICVPDSDGNTIFTPGM